MSDLAERLTAALGERYEIGGLIGTGGMAVVYRARDRKHGREVAIKVLRQELTASLGSERFLREIQIAANLHHPHILQLFDSGDAEGLLYYIMPLVRGETLRQLMDGGPLALADMVRLVGQIADALDYAHQQGVVHRDIKPENILIESGHALVADFGIGRALSGAQLGAPNTLTEAGLAVGTPSYMSPEQIDGRTLDGRSDLYSLACVGYEMLAGSTPFTAVTVSGMMHQHLLEPPPSISQVRSEVPDYAAAALQKGMAKVPDERFATAAEFADALHSGTTPPGPIRAPRRRKRGLIGAGLVAGVLALIAGFLVWRSWSATPAASASAVAVFPFTVGQSDSLGLADGMVTLLSTKLDGAGELRTVDPRALMSYLTRQHADRLDEAQARAIARRFQAGLYVLGDVLDIAGRITLTASLYDARHTQPIARATQAGNAAEIFEMVDGLASQLLAGWGGGQSRVTQIAAVTTHSLPAMKAYLEGEDDLRTGQFDRALDAFGRAGEADTTFALAWYRQSVAAEWLTRSDVARPAADRALQLSARLPERERQLLQAMVLVRHGNYPEAERIFRTILGNHPDDIEAWIQLGELQFHNAAWRGLGSAGISRDAWERVLYYDPENIGAMVHLARIAASEGRHPELDSLVARIQAIHERTSTGNAAEARSETLEMQTLHAFAMGDPAQQDSTLADLSHSSDVTVIITSWDVTSFAGNPDGALRVTRVATAPSRSPRVRVVTYGMLAHIEMGMGRRMTAAANLDTAATIDPGAALEFRAYLETLPFLQTSTATLEHLRQQLTSQRYSPPPSPDEMSTYYKEPGKTHRQVRLYLLGLLDAALGDSVAALKKSVELSRMPSPEEVPSLSNDLAAGIRAELAWRRGDMEGVLGAAKDVKMEVWYQDAVTAPFYDAARQRFLAAMASQRLGRPADALPLFGSFAEISQYDCAFTGPATLGSAQALERLGRTSEAARFYQKALRILKDADPEFQVMADSARAGIARAH